jgi:hypothetical protein
MRSREELALLGVAVGLAEGTVYLLLIADCSRMRYTLVCQARTLKGARLTNSALRLYLNHLQSAVI